MLSWDFTLLGSDTSSVPDQHLPDGQTRSSEQKVDVGFSVLGRTQEGFFPQLVPYR